MSIRSIASWFHALVRHCARRVSAISVGPGLTHLAYSRRCTRPPRDLKRVNEVNKKHASERHIPVPPGRRGISEIRQIRKGSVTGDLVPRPEGAAEDRIGIVGTCC